MQIFRGETVVHVSFGSLVKGITIIVILLLITFI